MVIPDPPIYRGPLEMRVILYPKMEIKMTGGAYAVAGGAYSYNFRKAPGFIAAYGLVAGGALYPSEPNKVIAIAQNDWLAGGIAAIVDEASATPMANASIPYNIVKTGVGKMLVFVGQGGALLMAEFEDNRGNMAGVYPLIVLDANYNLLQDLLIPEIFVERVSSTPTVCILRVNRSHAAPANAEFSNIVMHWFDDISGITPPAGILSMHADPADPLNDNKLIVECAPGIYKLGVVTEYQSTYLSTPNYPDSHMHCVVEIS